MEIREIIFRGKRIDNYEQCEGFFARYRNRTYIIEMVNELVVNWHEVIPETVGQYTGLKDKNGKRIFEGDIIRCGGKVVGVVNYHDCCFCVRFIMKDHANRSNPAMDIIENEYPNDIEVIGNIHDNKELLEVEG